MMAYEDLHAEEPPQKLYALEGDPPQECGVFPCIVEPRRELGLVNHVVVEPMPIRCWTIRILHWIAAEPEMAAEDVKNVEADARVTGKVHVEEPVQNLRERHAKQLLSPEVGRCN